jgi:hypothetical protein
MFRPQKTLKKTSVYKTIDLKQNMQYQQQEMKYMRKTAGHTWTDYKTNTGNRRNWLQHINRIPRNKL